MNLVELGKRAKIAERTLSNMPTSKKDEALKAIADALIKNTDKIIEANALDIKNAVDNGIKEAMVDRLKLTKERIKGIAQGVLEVIKLKDPVGEVLETINRPNGLIIKKKRVPIGVIGIIFEARPNVTVDAACLTLKTGNAVILRGGKEAINSNKILCDIMREAISCVGVNKDAINLITDTDRETAKEMMRLNGYIDVLIPRGGAGLIKSVVENATVPVIETGSGNCHTFVDESADIKMALDILINAKVQRPSVCNACESLVVHKNIAEKFIPKAVAELKKHGVEIRGCKKTCKIADVIPASDEDFYKEYNDLIISVLIVQNIDEAIDHINTHNTKHSECIVTENNENAQRFLNEIDAAAVYHNASTRFTDGFEFGFGAEIGISTQKLHARGPMGLNELTSTKYVIMGSGQIRG